MDTIEGIVVAGRRRRVHSAEFKAKLVQTCLQPGVSSAAIALAHGLNANLLRRWCKELPAKQVASVSPSPVADDPSDRGKFVSVRVAAGNEPVSDIRIELRRGASTASVSWPAEQAQACGAWLRDWLR